MDDQNQEYEFSIQDLIAACVDTAGCHPEMEYGIDMFTMCIEGIRHANEEHGDAFLCGIAWGLAQVVIQRAGLPDHASPQSELDVLQNALVMTLAALAPWADLFEPIAVLDPKGELRDR